MDHEENQIKQITLKLARNDKINADLTLIDCFTLIIAKGKSSRKQSL